LYVGDTHKQNVLTSSDSPDDINLEVLDAEATRLGSRALFYAALVTLVCNIALPFFIASPGVPKRRLIPEIRLVTLWAFSLLLFALCMMATLYVQVSSNFTRALTLCAKFYGVGRRCDANYDGNGIQLGYHSMGTIHIGTSC